MFNWTRKKAATAPGLVGLECGVGGMALAHIVRDAGGAPSLRHCIHESVEPALQSARLKEWVDANGLAGCRANVVLPAASYQLLLLDCPNVGEDELRDAMRWRVRDLITEPLESVVIDAFALPQDAYRGRSRMAYCAVMSKTVMHTLEAQVSGAGLRLDCIDIREMAFRNLGLLAGAEGLNIAVLRLDAGEGLITIQHGPDLYMARRIEQGLQRAAGDFSGITLEIQRSLDYFESQLGKGYLNRLLLAPAGQATQAIFEALSAGLAVNLQRLDLPAFLPGEIEASQYDAGLVAIGAALRQGAD